MRVGLTILTLWALSFLGGREAFSQDIGYESFGLRAGVSMNPDQFHGGVFADMGRLFRDVRFRPGFELGWGNGVFLGATNADALYFFGPSAGSWRPYAGGGLGINFIEVTNGVGEGRGLEIEPVLNLVGGIEWGKVKEGAFGRYSLEGRFGLGETPDFKLSAGLRF